MQLTPNVAPVLAKVFSLVKQKIALFVPESLKKKKKKVMIDFALATRSALNQGPKEPFALATWSALNALLANTLALSMLLARTATVPLVRTSCHVSLVAPIILILTPLRRLLLAKLVLMEKLV
jgi:hypothetical protein